MHSREWISLRGRRIRRLPHERVATPDFASPIHSRLQALARTSRPHDLRRAVGVASPRKLVTRTHD
eukprot:scaffold76848_cov66-Phaeocystis_antarctica.AAC.4